MGTRWHVGLCWLPLDAPGASGESCCPSSSCHIPARHCRSFPRAPQRLAVGNNHSGNHAGCRSSPSVAAAPAPYSAPHGGSGHWRHAAGSRRDVGPGGRRVQRRQGGIAAPLGSLGHLASGGQCSPALPTAPLLELTAPWRLKCTCSAAAAFCFAYAPTPLLPVPSPICLHSIWPAFPSPAPSVFVPYYMHALPQ